MEPAAAAVAAMAEEREVRKEVGTALGAACVDAWRA